MTTPEGLLFFLSLGVVCLLVDVIPSPRRLARLIFAWLTMDRKALPHDRN
jgi:hypothetical protein